MMVQLNFDVEVSEGIRAAPSDPMRVRALLARAASCLRRREVMPNNLADWLAEAFEASARMPELRRVTRALTDALSLTYGNRRPAVSWVDVGYELDQLSHELGTDRAAFDAFNEDRSESAQIDERTLAGMLRKYRKAREEHDKIE